MTEITIQNLAKRYRKDGAWVLDHIHLDIHAGELFFLLGPSGCGKTTLLRILAGLLSEDEGAIAFNGKNIDQLPPEKRNAALVFQNYALWPHFNVFDNVAFALRNRGIKGSQLRNKVSDALSAVQMLEFAERKIQALSGGQQQRVALARALAIEPPILLLDEPLSNLDAQLRDHMRSELRSLCKARNLTAVYVTHDRREALSMADRIAVMRAGKIEQVASPQELYRAPVNRFVGAFLGDANFLEAESVLQEDGSFAFRVPALGENKLIQGGISGHTTLQPGQKGHLMIRPEAVHFGTSFSGFSPLTVNRFEVTLESECYQGELSSFQCRLPDGSPFLVNESNPVARTAGGEFALYCNANDVVVLTD